MKNMLLFVLGFYQRWVSPLFPPRCRFQPTCSSYFIEALQTHGVLKGSKLGIVRLLKCHPFHSGGYDPCPEPHYPAREQSASHNGCRTDNH